MYIYLLKEKESEFMFFLKENSLSDDIILDRNNFNEHKIKLHIKSESLSLIANHFLTMPTGTMFTNQLESPGKEYILCIGDVDDYDFFVFLKSINRCAIATRKSGGVRVNTWVHFEDLHSLRESRLIHNLTSTSGTIGEFVWIYFEPFTKKHSKLVEKVFLYSDECIIREGQFYVKCLTHDFSDLMKEVSDCYERYEIVDEGTVE